MTDAQLESLLLPAQDAISDDDQDDQPIIWARVDLAELPVEASVLEARIEAWTASSYGGSVGLHVEKLQAARAHEHLTARGEAPLDLSHYRVVASVRLADGGCKAILAEVTVEDGHLTGREPVSFTVAD